MIYRHDFIRINDITEEVVVYGKSSFYISSNSGKNLEICKCLSKYKENVDEKTKLFASLLETTDKVLEDTHNINCSDYLTDGNNEKNVPIWESMFASMTNAILPPLVTNDITSIKEIAPITPLMVKKQNLEVFTNINDEQEV